MKILCFIPAYGRRHITETCYRALATRIGAAPPEYDINALCIVSNQPDEALAKKYGFNTVQVANKPLGRKFNAGLKHAFDTFNFDYILQLNSDNILSINFWEAFAPFLSQRLPFFGCNHIAIYDSETGRAFRYLYPTGCGIRFIRSDILYGAWCRYEVDNPTPRSGPGGSIPEGRVTIPHRSYKERLYGPILGKVFQLWTPDKDKGLDFDSENAIRQAWPEKEYRQRFPTGVAPLVVDIKGAENIHPIEEFEGDDMAQEWNEKEALTVFPELVLITEKVKK